MLSFKKYIAALLCLLLAASALTLISCGGRTGNDKTDVTEDTASEIAVIGENSFYSTIELSEYVSLCEYKGLSLDISDTDGSRENMES